MYSNIRYQDFDVQHFCILLKLFGCKFQISALFISMRSTNIVSSYALSVPKVFSQSVYSE